MENKKNNPAFLEFSGIPCFLRVESMADLFNDDKEPCKSYFKCRSAF